MMTTYVRTETILHPVSLHERTASVYDFEVDPYDLEDLEEGKDNVTRIVTDDAGVKQVTIQYSWCHDHTQIVTVTYDRKDG